MRAGLLIPALILVLASCAGQVSENRFIKASDSDDGLYEFKVDIQDTISLYDFSFYTRVDGIYQRSKSGTVPLDIFWISPSSGKVLAERVYIGRGDMKGLCVEYRSGVRLSEQGEWSLCVRPVNPPKGFRGMGLIVEKNGTR